MNNDSAYAVSRLSEKRRIARDCYLIYFEHSIEAIPGQFAMIWIPGIDEIPMSISHMEENRSGFTVKIVGKATDALCSLHEGDRVRIRGPYGRGFELRGGRALVVAGGVGIAPLLPLVNILERKEIDCSLIIGAKNEESLVLAEGYGEICKENIIATEDGSSGFTGTATDLCREILVKSKFDSVYCCGPEEMILSIVKIAEENGLWGQASIERYMKCGIGICGSCAINGKLVCKNGPVFDFNELRELREFCEIATH